MGNIQIVLNDLFDEDLLDDSKEYEEDEEEMKMDILHKQMTKRKFIEEEIIATEETYYMLLKKLLNELIIPMFTNKYIEIQHYDQMVSTIPRIVKFHKRFLEKLKHRDIDHEKRKSLGLVFKECIMKKKRQFIEIYVEFIKNYQKICDKFMNLFDGNLDALRFLKDQKLSTKMFLNFLILPVQRIPRYILLLSELRKSMKASDSADWQDINDAVEMIKDITNEINERKRVIDIEVEIGDEWMEPITKENRLFVREVSFITLFIIFILLFYVLFSYLFFHSFVA